MIDYNKIAKVIGEADGFLIGASNGLSISEGLNLFDDNNAFDKLFGDLKSKYGIKCLLHGMSARWRSVPPSNVYCWRFVPRSHTFVVLSALAVTSLRPSIWSALTRPR